MKKILILGASSAIAQATARLYCNEDTHYYLVGRNKKKLGIVKEDLLTRGAGKIDIDVANPAKSEFHEFLISRAVLSLGQIDLALIAHGNLPDQKQCEKSASKTINALVINSLSVISLATIITNLFEERNKGVLVVLSSVAGDRGRASNYIYGAAKSSVSTFLEGLSYRLNGTGISVITIKLGFVDTPMTEEFDKSFLWAQPETIAEGIKKAVEKRKSVVYLPWFWKWIMLVIKMIPAVVFKRLSL